MPRGDASRRIPRTKVQQPRRWLVSAIEQRAGAKTLAKVGICAAKFQGDCPQQAGMKSFVDQFRLNCDSLHLPRRKRTTIRIDPRSSAGCNQAEVPCQRFHRRGIASTR